MKTLVGFKKFKSKAGIDLCVAQIVADATEREMMYGLVGQSVQEVFLPQEYINVIKPEHIGHEIELFYEASGSRAYISGVKIK